ncbi:protein Aster-B-like isoform X2 [Aethina tumida]|uniref:protein Aster-B-like isoform X2 n=1 Tax=Aethina tumida TaxID=116153 RepID=UPI002147CBF6|nr:protein Aster-B-like isoform X2 [Aethina tumida]
MKMTLSSPSSTNSNDRQPVNFDQKSLSPSSSPRSSPRPSPRPQTKKEHKSDTHLSVNYKEQTSFKHEGSPSSQEGSVTGISISTPDITPPSEYKGTESGASTTKERSSRSKKKSSWFNSFYPTYKSRSEDFKRIFKDVPDDERLVVDYSCALQKEILVHGRLYVTQNYLCFYANIFGWETNVSMKWKEVTSISKEKTALVIPNAVLISTRADQKFFFTSFVARDKTYIMLFRVWQNALMDQPMSASEMWTWVHQSYGDELGLTSDDEDYIAPGTEDDKLSARSIESFSENEGVTEGVIDPDVMEDLEEKPSNIEPSKAPSECSHIPTDRSETESDQEKSKTGAKSKCTSKHGGRQLVKETMPIHLDQLFTLLFTSSKFYLDFHASRKTTDLTQTPWTHNPVDNSKSRVVCQTIALSHAMGPKSAQVTETQVMLPCSKAGQLYAIDIETVNAGVPYADSFVVLVHYCLEKISDTQSSMSVYAQIKYKKSVWGLVKTMIEKNCWSGLVDFFGALVKALRSEAEGDILEIRKSKRKKRLHSLPKIEKSRVVIPGRKKLQPCGLFSSDTVTLIVFFVLMILVFLNVMLYMKLWSLEESPPYTIDVQVIQNLPKSHDEWIQLLQKQESLHTIEVKKWQKILKTAVGLLKQAEESLSELQKSIYPKSLMKGDSGHVDKGGEL